MVNEQEQAAEQRKDFFISYTGVDRAWAEWIAWHLEAEGYSVIIQAWDFPAGSSFIHKMDQATREAERTIAVLSPDYFHSRFTPPEWEEAKRRDPTGEDGLLLPIRVRECKVDGLLGAIGYIDLVDLDEQTAREKLLAHVQRKRAKPSRAPSFPGTSKAPAPAYPGGKSDTSEQPSASSTAPEQLWTIPYPRNSLFTGRDAELQAIADTLKAGQNAAIGQAISGLGGIGKTQTALEYAYRHRDEYCYVFWASAATRDTLNVAYSRFAQELDLPGKDLAEQRLVVEAFKRWLANNHGWLLILDNADDLSIIPDYLPSRLPGHLLLTTRAHALRGLAEPFEIKKLDEKQAVQFLLRRSGVLSKRKTMKTIDPGERTAAGEIVRELDGLPLALNQAGAYIEETSCGLQGYLALYQKERRTLLRIGDALSPNYHEPVATTWQLSFSRVEQANPAAADLLRLCAFLAPDDIPELIITGGASELTPALQDLASSPLKLNAAIAELQKYSLIGRTPAKKMLDVHRLVQVALRDAMEPEVERAWAERTVRAVSQVFPWPGVETWETCKQLLQHGQACAELIEQWQMESVEGAHLLHNVGEYFYQHGEYREAQDYYEQALAIKRKVLGKEDRDTLISQNNLAGVYHTQGKYEEAAPLYEQSLAVRRKVLGEQDPDTALSLHNLAGLYAMQDKYEEAALLYEQALTIRRKVLGEQHPDIARSLEGLAIVYEAQEKYADAKSLYRQALAIYSKMLGEDHPETARCLSNLAGSYSEQDKYEEAALLYEQALAIRRKVLGEQHPDTARSMYNLGLLYQKQKRYGEALPLFERALAIRQAKLGPEHPWTKNIQRASEETLQLMEEEKRGEQGE